MLPSIFYLDRDDDKFKETDLLAYKQIVGALKDSPNYPYRVTIGLLLECKKREHFALVFFPRPRKATDIDFGGVGLAAIDSIQVAKMSSFAALHKLPLPRRIGFDLKPRAFVPIPIARQLWGAHQQPNFVEARDFGCLSTPEKSLSFDVVRLRKANSRFRRNDEREEIHLALSGLAKAIDERLVSEAEGLQILLEAALDDDVVKEQPHLRQFSFYYFFSALVLDGKLKVWRKNKVTDVNETLLEVRLHSGQYFGRRLVTVVTKDHLGEWLKELENDAKRVVQKLIKQRDKLDKQVGLLLNNRITPGRTRNRTEYDFTPDELE